MTASAAARTSISTGVKPAGSPSSWTGTSGPPTIRRWRARPEARQAGPPAADRAEGPGPAAPARDAMGDLRIEPDPDHQAEEPPAGPPEVDPPGAPGQDRGGQRLRVGGGAERPREQVLVPRGQNGERQAGRHLVDHVGDRAVAPTATAHRQDLRRSGWASAAPRSLLSQKPSRSSPRRASAAASAS